MKSVLNPKLSRDILNALREEYEEDKPLAHVTELIYCLTRSYYNRTSPADPTDQEVMLFATGFGLERVLLKKHRRAVVRELHGISLSPDFISFDGNLGELKTTRTSSKRLLAGDFSEGWMRQIMAYAYSEGVTEFDLGVLCLMGNYAPPFPELVSFRLEFTQEELEGNWSWLLARRDAYLGFINRAQAPNEFTWNMDWECKYCRYKMVCDMTASYRKEKLDAKDTMPLEFGVIPEEKQA